MGKFVYYDVISGPSVRNPVDTSVGWGPDGLKPMLDTIRIVSESPNVDFILYHTSEIMHRMGADEWVAGAFMLFIDFINMFIRVLMLLMGGRRD